MTQANEKFIQINGHRMSYLEQGEGPPVILIHGIPTSNLLWRRVMPRLATTRKVYAPDMLNYGKSDKPIDANVSIDAQSRFIVQLMDQLNLKAADIVAHDIGGGVAQLIAVNYPERVRKLVLIDSVCFDSWPIPEFLPLQKAGAEEGMSLEAFVTMMRGFMPEGVHSKAAMTNEVIDLYLGPWSTEDGKRALFRNFRRLNPEYTLAIAGELKHLSHNTLIIWAEHDIFQKPAYARKLQETIPHAELKMIKDAGHWVMEDQPEELTRCVMAFLERN